MLSYLIRRLIALPVVMLLVTALLFGMMLLLPAEQRVMVYIPSVNPHLTAEEIQELIQHEIERHGLDLPFGVQYVRWLSDLVTGDWGYSPTWRQPVLEGLRRRVPATLELSLFAFLPSTALAVALGTLAARYRGRLPDHLVRGAAAASWAFPPFVLGLILMNVFYAWLHWFPPERLSIWATFAVREPGFRAFTGLHTIDALLNLNTRLFVDAVRHLVLPATTLAITQWALFTRVMRSSLLRVMREDYIVMAQAKGLTDRNVLRRHARRNAVIPMISVAGAVTSAFIGNLVVVEVIFHINGVGRWAAKAIPQSDVPVALGFALFGCSLTVLASLAADIAYGIIDPRVRQYT